MNGEMDNFIPKWMQEGGIASSPISIMRLEALPAQKPASFEPIDPYGKPVGTEAEPIGQAPSPPWEKWITDDVGGPTAPVWDVWFGDCDGSFVLDSLGNPAPADPIRRFEFEVINPYDDTTSSMSLKIGDDTPEADVLLFSYLNGDGGKQGIQFDWTTGPEIQIAEDIDDPTSGNNIDITLVSGPLIKVSAGTNYAKLDVQADPLIEIYDQDGNKGTTVMDGNSLNLTDGDSGDTIIIDVSVPSFEITVSDSGDVTTLGDGDLHMSADDGSISIGAESEDGYIIVGDSKMGDGSLDLGASGSFVINGTEEDGYVTVGDTKLGDGSLDLGSSGSFVINGTAEDGAVVVGDSKLTDGDLELGSTGSITMGHSGYSGSKTYEPAQIQDCNGKKLWILADTSGWV